MKSINLVCVVCLFCPIGLLAQDNKPIRWKQLVQAGAQALPDVLHELETSDATSANWLRTAADAIIEKELAAGRSLDVSALETFLKNTANAPRSRRMVYEWIIRVNPDSRQKLLAGFMNDPSMELRRDAVAEALAQLPKEGDRKAGLRKILNSARDRDQVDAIAKELKTLGDEVDLAAHFGFVRDWMVLSTFDNTGEKGFAAVYEPEKKLDWKSLPTGKDNKPAAWKRVTSADPYGKMNLAKDVGKHKAAVAYAVAIVKADKPAPVELRANSPNAVKVWLNGKELIAHEEYHHGDSMDQYIGKGSLKQGENIILVKICQNDQKEVWAQSWEFALRVCDATGSAIKVELVPAPVQTASVEK